MLLFERLLTTTVACEYVIAVIAMYDAVPYFASGRPRVPETWPLSLNGAVFPFTEQGEVVLYMHYSFLWGSGALLLKIISCFIILGGKSRCWKSEKR